MADPGEVDPDTYPNPTFKREKNPDKQPWMVPWYLYPIHIANIRLPPKLIDALNSSNDLL